MPTNLNILVIPTYSSKTLGIADMSFYDVPPTAPSLDVIIPSLGKVSIPFNINDFNVLNSTVLGITEPTDSLIPLPDGVYTITYSIAPAYLNFITINIMRVEQLQEKFDNAFMKLDLMECDGKIKEQSINSLNTIWMFIQSSIAAANNCAIDEANKLYSQASKMLNTFNKTNKCNCNG
jgi:hypothetical protein